MKIISLWLYTILLLFIYIIVKYVYYTKNDSILQNVIFKLGTIILVNHYWDIYCVFWNNDVLLWDKYIELKLDCFGSDKSEHVA